MNKQTTIGIIIVAVLVVVGIAISGGTGSKQQAAAPKETGTATAAWTLDNGLALEDLTVGTGAEAKAGDMVTVNYIGRLTNGQEFDNSYTRGNPIQFSLGAGQLIPGFEQGVLGMKVGGKRKLTIPPALGYGDQGAGGIPGKSTLVFEVELMGVKNKK